MLPSSESIPNDSLSRLNANAIDQLPQIVELLQRAKHDQVSLQSRLSLVLERQSAEIEEIDGESLHLRTHNFDADQPSQIFLNLALGGRRYFFAVPKLAHEPGAEELRVGLPSVMFFSERRDRPRRPPSEQQHDPTRVALHAAGRSPVEAVVDDVSAEGMLLRIEREQADGLPTDLTLSFLDGGRVGRKLYGLVKHRVPAEAGAGWQRIGLSTSAARSGPEIPIERRDAILPTGRVASARQRWDVIGAGARLAAERALHRVTGRGPALPQLRTVRFENDRGEHLTGIVDSFGDARGAPLVLIPPAWAKTKETLLPLARTIVDSFRNANENIVVVRLDGIRRRGESYNDPECEATGRECHHMTFSQGAADIRAALDYFSGSEDFKPSSITLVTFSGAAIEARRALTLDEAGRVGGWVSVVGAADLKSGLRTVSGGVDYIGGAEHAVHFGIQRILGIEVDMDRVAADAVAHDMAYLEDARCEMEKLTLPITWIQGKYDAWIEPERVRQILSCGDASNRRLIEVPTGHQLRSSREALDTFQLVAQEIGRIVLGREIAPVLPDLAALERRRQGERARLPKPEVDLKHFWRDYLLGRDRHLGMELLTITSPYRALIRSQVEALDLRAGQRVADLGSGTGALPVHLLTEGMGDAALRIDEIDYVPEALERARARIADVSEKRGRHLDVHFLECDLDAEGSEGPVPVADGSYDRLVASLLLNYVKSPEALLREARRLLQPGGRIVLSTLRRDVDISRIYQDVASELRAGAAREALGETDERVVESDLREFLNEAARLLDLEERGVFHFWDADELVALLQRAGFRDVETGVSFGDPPQAIVATAVRA